MKKPTYLCIGLFLYLNTLCFSFGFFEFIQTVSGTYQSMKDTMSPFMDEIIKTNDILRRLDVTSQEESSHLNSIKQFVDRTSGDDFNIAIGSASDISEKDIYDMKVKYYALNDLSDQAEPWIGRDLIGDGEDWLLNIFSTEDAKLSMELKGFLDENNLNKTQVERLSEKALEKMQTSAALESNDFLAKIKSLNEKSAVKLNQLLDYVSKDREQERNNSQTIENYFNYMDNLLRANPEKKTMGDALRDKVKKCLR
jgi:hypothetical protein